MSEVKSDSDGTGRRSGFRPPRPIEVTPLFRWPLRPVLVCKWLFGVPGYLWPWPVVFLGLASLPWLFAIPDVGQMRTLSAGWVTMLFATNAAVLVLFAGVWHWWLFSRKAQGGEYKYAARWLSTDDPTFLFRNQLYDNVFWNLCSAVPVWTLYEIVTFWLYGHGIAPGVSWRRHPVYCGALLLLTPVWLDVHFYVIHRFLHWKPLYRAVHYLHHKNVNIGPWSGLAMHPLEHLLYFSGIALYWIIPAHPLHYLYLLESYALGPTLQHHGFHRLRVGRKHSLDTDHYMHYLHHKYVRVNFSTGLLPLDKWLGTFYDGSETSLQAFRRRGR